MSADDFDPFGDAPIPGTAAAAAKDKPGDDLPPNARVVSVTEIERFLECGHRHAMYASRLWREEQDGPRTRGSAVHAARGAALKAYLKKGALPSSDDLEAVAATKVEELLLGSRANSDDLPEDDPLRLEVAQTIDDAVTFVRADLALLLPAIAPHVLEVEEKFIVPLATAAIAGEDAAPWFLKGTPDSIGRDPTTGKLVLPDLKTGTKATSQAALNTSSQLTGYAFLAEQRFGEIPILAHHSLRILKRLPKPKPGLTWKAITRPGGEEAVAVAEKRSTERTYEDLDSFVRRLNVYVSAQVAGVAMPATASNFMSPCHRCLHRGHREPSQRCPFAPAFRGAEAQEDDDAE